MVIQEVCWGCSTLRVARCEPSDRTGGREGARRAEGRRQARLAVQHGRGDLQPGRTKELGLCPVSEGRDAQLGDQSVDVGVLPPEPVPAAPRPRAPASRAYAGLVARGSV